MKAWIVSEYGPNARFEPTELERPSAGPGELIIEVKATSLNPLDHKLLTGHLGVVAPETPAVLHGDVAGIVTEVGSGVKGFQVGDQVYGMAGGVIGSSGALAEYMKVDAALIAKKPYSLSFAEAAALPLVAITAWEGLVDKAQLKSGQTVFVYGSHGGVGHVALQLAKALGATVTSTISSEEPDLSALITWLTIKQISLKNMFKI